MPSNPPRLVAEQVLEFQQQAGRMPVGRAARIIVETDPAVSTGTRTNVGRMVSCFGDAHLHLAEHQQALEQPVQKAVAPQVRQGFQQVGLPPASGPPPQACRAKTAWVVR